MNYTVGKNFDMPCPHCGVKTTFVYQELYEALDALELYCWYCHKQFLYYFYENFNH